MGMGTAFNSHFLPSTGQSMLVSVLMYDQLLFAIFVLFCPVLCVSCVIMLTEQEQGIALNIWYKGGFEGDCCIWREHTNSVPPSKAMCILHH
jgi:hypothetical protein